MEKAFGLTARDTQYTSKASVNLIGIVYKLIFVSGALFCVQFSQIADAAADLFRTGRVAALAFDNHPEAKLDCLGANSGYRRSALPERKSLRLIAILKVNVPDAVAQANDGFYGIDAGHIGPIGVDLELDTGPLFQLMMNQDSPAVGHEFVGMVVIPQRDTLSGQLGLHIVEQVDEGIHLFCGAEIAAGRMIFGFPMVLW